MRCRMCGSSIDDEGTDLCPDCAVQAQDPQVLSRRRFLGWGALAVGGILGAGYLGAGLTLLYPNTASAAGRLQDIGPVEAFPLGQYILQDYTGEGYEDGVYVMNRGHGTFIALDFHCTHLQCPVQWVQSQEKFFCPCHGSVYNRWGKNIAGPAPRPLFPHLIRVQDGRVLLGPQLG